jgi:hypothetical protein
MAEALCGRLGSGSRLRAILDRVGVPSSRVVLATYRSEMDDQTVTVTYGHSEAAINKFYDNGPAQWRVHRESKLNIFRQISARYERASRRVGLPEAEERWHAADKALAPIERKLLDTPPTSLAGAIAKLRMAVSLGWDSETPLGGQNLADQDLPVRVVAEAIAFLDGRGGR